MSGVGLREGVHVTSEVAVRVKARVKVGVTVASPGTGAQIHANQAAQ
jgi:hypothetical protein